MAFKFNPQNAQGARQWPVLPEGDYPFIVTSCTFPTENPNGYDIIKIELLVKEQKIWSNCCAGVNSKGVEFDMISPFLVAINRIPKGKEDQSPTFWAGLTGAKGVCHLISETWQGVERNKVEYYHAPKQAAKNAKNQPSDIDPSDELDMGKLEYAPGDIPF